MASTDDQNQRTTVAVERDVASGIQDIQDEIDATTMNEAVSFMVSHYLTASELYGASELDYVEIDDKMFVVIAFENDEFVTNPKHATILKEAFDHR